MKTYLQQRTNEELIELAESLASCLDHALNRCERLEDVVRKRDGQIEGLKTDLDWWKGEAS